MIRVLVLLRVLVTARQYLLHGGMTNAHDQYVMQIHFAGITTRASFFSSGS